jgi:hypothetical protein
MQVKGRRGSEMVTGAARRSIAPRSVPLSLSAVGLGWKGGRTFAIERREGREELRRRSGVLLGEKVVYEECAGRFAVGQGVPRSSIGATGWWRWRVVVGRGRRISLVVI